MKTQRLKSCTTCKKIFLIEFFSLNRSKWNAKSTKDAEHLGRCRQRHCNRWQDCDSSLFTKLQFSIGTYTHTHTHIGYWFDENLKLFTFIVRQALSSAKMCALITRTFIICGISLLFRSIKRIHTKRKNKKKILFGTFFIWCVCVCVFFYTVVSDILVLSYFFPSMRHSFRLSNSVA